MNHLITSASSCPLFDVGLPQVTTKFIGAILLHRKLAYEIISLQFTSHADAMMSLATSQEIDR